MYLPPPDPARWTAASLHRRGTGSMSFYGNAFGTAVEGWFNSQLFSPTSTVLCPYRFYIGFYLGLFRFLYEVIARTLSSYDSEMSLNLLYILRALFIQMDA